MKHQKLLALQERLNKDHAGKSVAWASRLAKAVGGADARADVTVPGWVQGATARQIPLNNTADLGKYYLVSASFAGDWVKSVKRGGNVTLIATVREVIVSTNGVSVAITNVAIRPVEAKK